MLRKKGSSVASFTLRKCALVLAAFVIGALIYGAARAQSPEPGTGLLNSKRAIAVNPISGKVYAVNPEKGKLTVYDPQSNSTKEIAVGAGPISVALNPSTNRIYVANHDAASISVLDGAKDEVIATLPIGNLPYAIAVNAKTNKIYVSNTFSNIISMIDGATNSVEKIKAGSADTILVDEKLGRVYLIGYEGAKPSILNDVPAITGNVEVGIHLWGTAVNEPEAKVYATRSGNSELAVIDESTGTVKMIPTGSTPCAVAENASTKRIYVVNHMDDSVTVIDTNDWKPIATIPVGHRPQSVAIDARANRIYIANRNDSTVSVIDGVRNEVVRTVPAATWPYALAVNPQGSQLYVAAMGDKSFQALSIP